MINLKIKKMLIVNLLPLFLIFSLTGCGNKQDFANEKNKQAVIDREGNQVNLPDNVNKIISLAPSITETLINLGLEDNIIAVDKYSADLEEIDKNLPTFDIMVPDAESIVNLQPDIIFGTGMSKSNGTDPFKPMVEMGTFVTIIPTPSSIEGIIEDIKFIGKVTKTDEKANEITDKFINEIKDIREKIDEKNNTEDFTVFFETSPAPNLFSFGKNVFLNEMLEILKLKNIFSEIDGWSAVSEEQIIKSNPQIIFTTSDFLENPVQEIKNRNGWKIIDAVKNDRVYLIDTNSASRPNENSIKAFREMAEYVYPDIFINN